MYFSKRGKYKAMKILSIGNSFSQDAQRYLYGIARSDGTFIKNVNIYIGGCTLSRHYRNLLDDSKKPYSFEINGITNTGIFTSIKEALLSDEWDYVTVQQQSLASCDFETFIPYIDTLCEHIRLYCPKAKIILLRTWGYKEGSAKLENAGYATHADMFADIQKAYTQAEERTGAEFTVPLGDAVALAVKKRAENIYRDDFHMSLGFGRYLLALVLYGKITGRPIENITFSDLDKPISEEELLLAKEIAAEVLGKALRLV